MHHETRDHGIQPVDALINQWGLTNHQLVETSVEQLNHKQVHRACSGRQLTLHLMQKVTRTLNEAIFATLKKDQQAQFTPYLHKHLFNYAKNYSADWKDPNTHLMPNPPTAE